MSRTAYIASLPPHLHPHTEHPDRVTVRGHARSYLHLDRRIAWGKRDPETLWEDHQRVAERLEGTSGPLRLDGARSC